MLQRPPQLKPEFCFELPRMHFDCLDGSAPSWSSASAASCCLAQPLSDSWTSAPACSYLRGLSRQCRARFPTYLSMEALRYAYDFTRTVTSLYIILYATIALVVSTVAARVLLVPLVEGLLRLLHGLVDTKEVLVAEGVDGLGLVELLCSSPAVLEPDTRLFQSKLGRGTLPLPDPSLD